MSVNLPKISQKLLLFTLFWGVAIGFIAVIVIYPAVAKLALIAGTFVALCFAFWQLAEITINDRSKLGK